MSEEVYAINALVEQAASQQQQQETPEQIAAREAAAAQPQETPEQIAAREAAASQQQQETAEQIAAREAAASQQQSTEDKTPAELKAMFEEFGVKSVEELKSLIKKDEVQETPEQAKKKEESYKAAMISYAVENDLIRLDDVTKLETLKAMSDEDVVFDNFAKEIKDEILEDPDLPEDVSEEEIVSRVKEAFEKEFPINSKNEKTKLRAEAKLAKAAKDIRGPLESSFNTAKEKYNDEVSIRQAYPKYHDEMKKTVSSLVPKSYSFYKEEGDDPVSADIELTKDDKDFIEAELTKIVQTPETFLLHKNGKVDEIKKQMEERVEFLMFKRLGDAGKRKVAELYEGRGITKGSAVGASNTFAVNRGGLNNQPKTGVKTGDEAKTDVLDSTRQK